MSTSGRDEVLAFLGGALIGGLVGAGVALLLAPQSGEETREQIRQKGIELKDRGDVALQDLRRRADEASVEFRRRTEELKKAIDKSTEDIKAAVEGEKSELAAEAESKG